VNLSSKYNINSNITNYSWSYIDDNGNYQTITQPTNPTNGVFTFMPNTKKLCCSMINKQFPILYLKYEVYINETVLQITQSQQVSQYLLTQHQKTLL
jgi:hypothetical protein